MKLEETLCKAFCDALTVRQIPAGLAIGTAYDGSDNDPLGFYVIGPDESKRYRIQDDGMSVATLEAQGASLSNETRRGVFNTLLDEYGIYFDEGSHELTTHSLAESEIPAAALRFIAFLLRVQDILFTSQERAASTFKDDAIAMLRQQASNDVQIVEKYVVAPVLKDFPADIALLVSGRPPVAVFVGSNDAHVGEALLLHAYAEKAGVPCKVLALVEAQSSLSKKTWQRASNHLHASPVFRGDEAAACARIIRAAQGDDQQRMVH